MGDVQGPEKVKDTCMKTIHVETMDRGFAVDSCYCSHIYLHRNYTVTKP
jgi:hypothetical protein